MSYFKLESQKQKAMNPTYQEEVLKVINVSKFIERHRDPKVGLFINRYKLSSPSITYLSVYHAENIKRNINKSLEEIEGVRWSFNPKTDVWSLEFGTKPIQKTIDSTDQKLKQIVNKKQWEARNAAIKALEKYPYLIDDVHDGLFDHNLRWFQCFINLSYSEEERRILMEYVRTDGDSITFYHIKNEFERILKKNTKLVKEKKD